MRVPVEIYCYSVGMKTKMTLEMGDSVSSFLHYYKAC